MENFKSDNDLKPFFDALRQHVNEPMSLDMVREKVGKLQKTKKSKTNIMNISIILSIASAIALYYTNFSSPQREVHPQAQEAISAQKPAEFPNTQGHSRDQEAKTDQLVSQGSPRNNPVNKSSGAFQKNVPGFPESPLWQTKSAVLTQPPIDTARYASTPLVSILPFGLSGPQTKQGDTSLPGIYTMDFPFQVLKLSVEELENLGIYSGSSGIFFEAVQYSDEPFQFYYLPSISGVRTQSQDILYKKYFPVMLTDRYFKNAEVIHYHLDYETTLAEKKAMTKDLIPVIAYANNNPRPIFWEEQIFWFRKTEEIIQLMPARVQQDVRDNKYVWDLTKDSIQFTPEISEMQSLILKDIEKQKEGKNIAFDSTYAIHADENLLKKLNFISNTRYINYHYKSVKFTYSLHIDPKTNDTGFNSSRNTGKDKHILYAQKRHKIPLFKFDHYLPFSPTTISEVGNVGVTYTAYQDYMLQKHALIPVIVRNKHVYWYYPTPNFMRLLSPEQSKMASLYLQRHKNDSMLLSSMIVGTNYPSIGSFKDLRHQSEPAFSFTKLELDSLTLAGLGIVIHDKSVSYFFKSGNEYVETNFSKRGTEISFDKKKGTTYASNTALIITDDLGRFPRMSLDSTAMNTIDFNTLVPVYAKTNDNYTNIDQLRRSWRPDVIFWFKPDSAFLAALPKQIATPMASDVRLIENKSNGGSCTYFDACKTLTPNISTYRFFPNPATNQLNIELKTSSSSTMTVQLFDMEGKAVLQKFSFETSDNKLNAHIDISQLPSGIYNVVLETANGDKIISRIIVMH